MDNCHGSDNGLEEEEVKVRGKRGKQREKNKKTRWSKRERKWKKYKKGKQKRRSKMTRDRGGLVRSGNVETNILLAEIRYKKEE